MFLLSLTSGKSRYTGDLGRGGALAGRGWRRMLVGGAMLGAVPGDGLILETPLLPWNASQWSKSQKWEPKTALGGWILLEAKGVHSQLLLFEVYSQWPQNSSLDRAHALGAFSPHKAPHSLPVLRNTDSLSALPLGSHFRQRNCLQKAQKCQQHGTKQTKKRTLGSKMRIEMRRQSVPSPHLRRERSRQTTQMSRHSVGVWEWAGKQLECWV